MCVQAKMKIRRNTVIILMRIRFAGNGVVIFALIFETSMPKNIQFTSKLRAIV